MNVCICTICGRAVQGTEENLIPKFCAYDRTPLHLQLTESECQQIGIRFDSGSVYEFPGDVRFDIYTGDAAAVEVGDSPARTLQIYQMKVLTEAVHA